MNTIVHDSDGCTAWAPGVRPGIPREFRALETLYRPESAISDAEETFELSRITGLPQEELSALKPRRLALHELIIRVAAHIAIAEVEEEEEAFGRNFRYTVLKIWQDYVLPKMDEIEGIHARLQEQVAATAKDILQGTLCRPAPRPVARPFPLNLFLGPKKAPPPPELSADQELDIIETYRKEGYTAKDRPRREVYRSLHRVLGLMAAHGGRLGANFDLPIRLVTTHVSNRYGSHLIGEAIMPLIEEAIAKEGFVRLQNHPAPALFSLKGASASGKSSLRPMLRHAMRQQGIAPDTCMTISPDVWRRLLLDYDALGPARKYSGYLTSREIALIDGKLDRYIRDKARREGSIPNMVVDRFRFDSFSSDLVPHVLDATYAKYVDSMYMYFIVTPPEETVERGWRRALAKGRYKAVEDFLGHSVEAYEGMPKLLFKWLGYPRPHYRYIFLDNMVPKGTFPAVSAIGDQHVMTLYAPITLVNIERYQKINIHAESPDHTYPSAEDLAIGKNLGFLGECLRRLPTVYFVNRGGAIPYLQVRGGRGEIVDQTELQRALSDADTAEILRLLAPALHISLP